MMEDFGDWGDERFLGVCAEDWLWDVNEKRLHDKQEESLRLLQEDEVDDAWDRENERDLSDIVREHEESEEYCTEEDYYECSWEE